MNRRNRGAAALEFALVTPVLLLLLFAILDWSWYQFQAMTVGIAATRGARIAASVRPANDPAAVAEAEVRAWMGPYGLDPGGATVDVSTSNGALVVAVSAPFSPLVGLGFTPDTLGATASTVYYGSIYP